MPVRWLSRTDRLVGWLFQSRSLTGAWILRRTICLDNELNRKDHSCCSTYWAPIEWRSKVVHAQVLCNIPSRGNLHTGYSCCCVLQISYHIPSTTVKVMEAHEGEHPSTIVVYVFEHITKNGWMWVIKVSFSQARVGFMDQSCSESPQFVTTEWDIRSPSFRRSSLLPATYPIILRFILHHIVHL